MTSTCAGRTRRPARAPPPRWWYPNRGEAPNPDALALCRDCPVHADCLAHALRHEKFGLWAGTSEKRRRRLRRAAGIRFIPLEPADMTLEPDRADSPDDDHELEETA